MAKKMLVEFVYLAKTEITEYVRKDFFFLHVVESESLKGLSDLKACLIMKIL